MFRAQFAVLVAVIAASCVACFGGDKVSSEGQADYLERLMDVYLRIARDSRDTGCADEFERANCDEEAFFDAFDERLDEWDRLQPPPELRAEHKKAVATLRDLAKVGAVPTAEIVDAVSDARLAVLAGDSWEEFQQALQDHYRVTLFGFEGQSMLPAFCDDDMVALPEFDGTIGRWDVIFFHFPQDTSRDFVKRVVALPGETIEVREGAIYINGDPVEGDVYALAPPIYEVAPLTIPPDRYYVLGDNRRNSFDSHVWSQIAPADIPAAEAATVPLDLVIGKLPPDFTTCK